MSTATAQKKHQIQRAATHLFRERGFHATSVRDIAEAVGLQGGSLYAHMESKDDLLWEIVNQSADRFFRALDPVRTSNREMIQRFREAIVAHVGVITEDLDAAAVYTTEWQHLSAARQREFAGRRHEYELAFRGLIQEGIRAGVLSAVDETYATLFVLSTLNYVYLWFKPDGRMSSDEVARMMSDFVLDGLRRRTT